VTHAWLARDDAAVDPASFLRIPFDDLAAAQDLKPRLCQRLALFQRHRDRHRLAALAHHLRGLKDDLGAFGGRRARPEREACLGRFEGIVEIGAARVRHNAYRAFAGRVDDRLAVGPPPFAADVELQIGVLFHRILPVPVG